MPAFNDRRTGKVTDPALAEIDRSLRLTDHPDDRRSKRARGPLPAPQKLTEVTPRQMQAADAHLGEGVDLSTMSMPQAVKMYRRAVRSGMPHGWHD